MTELISKMNSLFSRKKILPIFIIITFIYLINFYLIYTNKSLLFNFDLLDKYGDQKLYISLAKNIIKLHPVPHIYSVGYSLFLVPFILAFKTRSWQILNNPIVITQAFIIMPIIWILISKIISFTDIFKRKLFGLTVISGFIFYLIYELALLKFSKDSLVFNLFFGLIPYSEPIGIFLLVFVYFIILRNNFKLKTKNLFFVGLLIALLLSVRVIFVVLVMPAIFIIFIPTIKDFKKIIIFSVGFILGYLPQLLYSYKAFGNPLASGYQWNWSLAKSGFAPTIEKLYGKPYGDLFNYHYLLINIPALFSHYIVILSIALLNIAIIFLYKKRLTKFNNIDYFFILCNFSNIIYIIIFLSYWWSKNSDLIDRFLIPSFFFSLISFSYSIKLIYNKKEKTYV